MESKLFPHTIENLSTKMKTTLATAALIGTSFATPFFGNTFDTSDILGRDTFLSSGCSTTGAASCHNTTKVTNLCCFESPGVGDLFSDLLLRRN